MRIAIDIMGGDNAPSEIIDGALNIARKYPDYQLILVGKKEALPADLPQNCLFHEATEVMAMDESVENLRHKPNCSIWQATLLVKEDKADAIISAGSTAAQMAAAILLLGRIKGISRPAICSVIPGIHAERLVLDIGANADCTAQMLYQFAAMGHSYAQIIWQKERPRIALLANGTEDHKGNQLTKEAHQLLADSQFNFIGNQEGRDLFKGDFDVLVADGFSCNIAIKAAEGAVAAIMHFLKEELTSSFSRKIGAALIKPGLRVIKNKLNYQQVGGAPLLGVNGLSIVCHGSSKAMAIENACLVAIQCIERDFVKSLAKNFAD